VVWVEPLGHLAISAAMVAVIVRAGMNSAVNSWGIRAALPVTIITAIVSPMARRCQHHAMITPDRRPASPPARSSASGAPMGQRPSRYSLGTASMASSHADDRRQGHVGSISDR